LRSGAAGAAREIPDHHIPLPNLAQVRASLAPGTVLVEYFQTGGQIIAAVLTSERLDVAPLASAEQARHHLRLLQLQLAKFRFGQGRMEGFGNAVAATTAAHLRQLYHDLVAPIRDRLEGSHLVFAPHGFLHYLPLHALHDGDRHLIDSFTVSYVPSAGVHALPALETSPASGPPLVVGVADPRAPWIRQEVEEVASILPDARLLAGEDATQARLRDLGADSRLVHIATHGVFRTDNPMFSAVRLSDSSLTLYDLYTMRLPAELLTLSGCATGLNVIAAGDELIGLARGLLYAGARSLLLTLWDVQDRSTAEFMRLFYTRLGELPDKAAALRAAMIELRETKHPHPFFWAPFVLVGKNP
jgi:CHAT domain-containing protein